MITVKVLNTPEMKELGLPKYETEGSSGVDLKSAVDLNVLPGERLLVKTGMKMAIPKGIKYDINNDNIPKPPVKLTGYPHIPIHEPYFNDVLDISFEAQIRPRSGLALKKGITVLNSPGTIDESYRGEICVIIFNTSKEPFEIKKGERIAQMVFVPVVKANFELVESLDETSRGEGGFGSTGV